MLEMLLAICSIDTERNISPATIFFIAKKPVTRVGVSLFETMFVDISVRTFVVKPGLYSIHSSH